MLGLSFLGLALYSRLLPMWLPLILVLLAAITFASLIHEILYRVPDYCWLVATYGLAVEHRSVDMPLDQISRHLSSGNWDEAGQMLGYYLPKLA